MFCACSLSAKPPYSVSLARASVHSISRISNSVLPKLVVIASSRPHHLCTCHHRCLLFVVLLLLFPPTSAGLGKMKAEELSTSNPARFAPDPNPFLPATEAQRMMGAYPDGDVARASLAQMNEISRRAKDAGMKFSTTGMNPPPPPPAGSTASSSSSSSASASASGTASASSSSAPVRPPSSASRIMAAAAGLLPGGSETPIRPMSRQDALARIEELSRARPASAQGGAGVGGSAGGEASGSAGGSGPSQNAQDSDGSGDGGGGAYDANDVFLFSDDGMRYGLPLSSPSLQHEGLQVYTVGHLMPKSSLDDANGNWAFDPGALNLMVMPTPQGGGGDPEQEGEHEPQRPFAPAVADAVADAAAAQKIFAEEGRPPSAQTLRVRRSTYVPGWAVPPRVLLVDDDAVSRRLSSKFLQVFGCTIDVAVDGVGAVNKMNLEKYDLVLMVRWRSFRGDFGFLGLLMRIFALQDIVMPKLDGVSATSMIRQFDAMTPIISMTSNSKPSEIIKYYSSGMNDILPKPFTKDGLLDMLEVRIFAIHI